MDFKSILTKLDGMDKPVATPAAPVLPKAPKLNESAELRILAGRSTLMGEATKMIAEADMKVGDKKPSSTGGTIEKTKTGVKHTAGNAYSGKAAEKEAKDKKVDEVFDKDAKPGDKKKTSSGGTAEKTKTGMKHSAGDRYSGKAAEKEKTDESIDLEEFHEEFDKLVEASKKAPKKGKKPDFLDMDKDGDKKEPMKKAVADKKKGAAPKKGVNPFAKKTVKESVEQKLTFKQMVQLVQESGGQQAIDPVDAELFAWAQRIASSKFNESAKQEVYAGLVYERMGGVFEMYDVLSEAKK